MRRIILFILGALLVPHPARASFHLMNVVEVFPGTAAQPSAQYVVLQMWSPGQNLVGAHSILVYDAAGSIVGLFTFQSHLPNGADQAKILIGTPAATSLTGVSADLSMTAVIPLGGGKVCFDSIDCVTWGNYGAADVGTPFSPSGLALGQAMRRKTGPDGILDPSDDTNDSASDFMFGRPGPMNNEGQGCGDGVPGALEQCDDGNASNTDDCVAGCAVAQCGDGFPQAVVEECDDGNLSNNDACLTSCTTATCGDGFTWFGVEHCDDGGTTNGDGCSATCIAEVIPPQAGTGSTLRASRAAATAVNVSFAPACAATDHVVYWGTSPVAGSLVWSGAACGLGTTGTASFNPGTPPPGRFQYFVVVGYTEFVEGSYGPSSAGAERPESTGVGACERPRALGGTCP